MPSLSTHWFCLSNIKTITSNKNTFLATQTLKSIYAKIKTQNKRGVVVVVVVLGENAHTYTLTCFLLCFNEKQKQSIIS